MPKFVSNYKDIFLQDIPLIDLRAPVEFEQGAFPYAQNIPLMSDKERELVGTCYKKSGPDAALKLGHELVNGETKAQRVQAWIEQIKRNPNTLIYCFRGGQRSQITQSWIKEQGVNVPYVKGGYKKLRHYLIDNLEQQAQRKIIILGGQTGNGKTIMINALKNGIDLEGAANHRGSAFGRYSTPQATQIAFENQVSIDMLKHQEQGLKTMVLEDESRVIGSVHIPKILLEKMTCSPIVAIEDPVETRIQRLFDDYVVNMHQNYLAQYGEDLGWEMLSEYYRESFSKIARRLGGERYKQMSQDLEYALQQHRENGNIEAHLNWLEPLLVDYYDPMYSYQLDKNRERIVFKGQYDEVFAYLQALK